MTKHEGFVAKPVNIRGYCDADVLKKLELAPEDDATRSMRTLKEAITLDVLKAARRDGIDTRRAKAIFNATGTWVR